MLTQLFGKLLISTFLLATDTVSRWCLLSSAGDPTTAPTSVTHSAPHSGAGCAHAPAPSGKRHMQLDFQHRRFLFAVRYYKPLGFFIFPGHLSFLCSDRALYRHTLDIANERISLKKSADAPPQSFSPVIKSSSSSVI